MFFSRGIVQDGTFAPYTVQDIQVDLDSLHLLDNIFLSQANIQTRLVSYKCIIYLKLNDTNSVIPSGGFGKWSVVSRRAA